VDPASRSWIAPGLQAAKWLEDKRYALQQVLSALGEQNLPDLMTHVLQSRWTLNHAGRLTLCTFLWGNGIDPDHIRDVLAPLIKRGREKDVEGILASLKSGSYDSKWFFFSTRYQIRLKLNGEVAEKLNDYSRWKIANYAWEMHMHKFGYGSTLAFQKRFFAEYGIDPVPGY